MGTWPEPVTVGFKNVSEHEAYDLRVRVKTRFHWEPLPSPPGPSPSSVFTESEINVEDSSNGDAPLLPGDEADFEWPVFLGRVEREMEGRRGREQVAARRVCVGQGLLMDLLMERRLNAG